MSKIDLDDLERRIESTPGNECSCTVTLALIARIRELEGALGQALDEWNNYDPGATGESVRATLWPILEKGAVSP